MARKHIVLWSFLGFVGVIMVAGASAILFPRWNGRDEVLASSALIGSYALGGMLVMLFGKRLPWTMRVFFVSMGVSLAFYLVGIWFERSMSWRIENRVWVTGSIGLTLGCGLAHRIIVWPIKATQFNGRLLRILSTIFAVSTTVLIMLGLLFEGFRWGRGYTQLVGLNVLAVSGSTIAFGAVTLFGPKPGDDEPGLLEGSLPISMTCPRCQTQVDAKSNKETRCSQCRLKIRVEVEEPRCSCGYLLYELESDICPECGKSIAAEDRWVNGKPAQSIS